MPFNRPTLDSLIDRAIADVESRLPGADARLRRSNLNALARVHAGAAHGLHGHLDWNARQILPDTADAENLDRFASIWLEVPRKAAAYASGTALFTGTTGTVIAAATIVTRADGAEFATDEEATIASGGASVAVTAVEAGQAGNTAASTKLTLTSPIAGVNGTATVETAGLTGGTETESDDALRARVIAAMRAPAQGGARHDYETWALEVAGVTRAWIKDGWTGDGTITVLFVRDDDASIFPDTAAIAAVQAHIDVQRPLGAVPTVIAPTAVALNIEIQLTPDTTAVRAAVEASIADLLLREAEPGATIYLSHIREAISIASGEGNHVLVSPVADVTHAAHEMASLGTVTFS